MGNHFHSCFMISLAACLGATACGDDGAGVDSDEEARRIYLGLDESIEKSLNLGFAGFNSASSANIDPQSAPGAAAGTLTITGQVDQGASANKGMRLRVGMVDYTDGDVVIGEGDSELILQLAYDTSAVVEEQPYLQLSLRDIPNGTFTGTLTGTYDVGGTIDGNVTLDLAMSGQIMDGGGGQVVRVPGSTTITGTATSGDGLYDVDITR